MSGKTEEEDVVIGATGKGRGRGKQATDFFLKKER